MTTERPRVQQPDSGFDVVTMDALMDGPVPTNGSGDIASVTPVEYSVAREWTPPVIETETTTETAPAEQPTVTSGLNSELSRSNHVLTADEKAGLMTVLTAYENLPATIALRAERKAQDEARAAVEAARAAARAAAPAREKKSVVAAKTVAHALRPRLPEAPAPAVKAAPEVAQAAKAARQERRATRRTAVKNGALKAVRALKPRLPEVVTPASATVAEEVSTQGFAVPVGSKKGHYRRRAARHLSSAYGHLKYRKNRKQNAASTQDTQEPHAAFENRLDEYVAAVAQRKASAASSAAEAAADPALAGVMAPVYQSVRGTRRVAARKRVTAMGRNLKNRVKSLRKSKDTQPESMGLTAAAYDELAKQKGMGLTAAYYDELAKQNAPKVRRAGLKRAVDIGRNVRDQAIYIAPSKAKEAVIGFYTNPETRETRTGRIAATAGLVVAAAVLGYAGRNRGGSEASQLSAKLSQETVTEHAELSQRAIAAATGAAEAVNEHADLSQRAIEAATAAAEAAGNIDPSNLEILDGDFPWDVLNRAGIADPMQALDNAAKESGLKFEWHGTGDHRWIEVEGDSTTSGVFSRIGKFIKKN